ALKFADVIVKAAKRAGQLTRQLLSLSRKDAVTRRVVNLNEAVRTTGKLLSETLDRKIRLEFDLTPETTNIKADETQLGQVLLNLAINARDAMPEGGTLRFTTRTEDDKVTVRVTDTGTGIDPENLSRIFDPFFTTKEKTKGTGLGLSVVYGIVKQTGGTIDVKSELDLGTEFIITFPASSEPRKDTAQKETRLAGGAEKIMVVDDEPEMLNLLETAMKDLGYTVVCAKNGMEAVEQAAEDIKLVILDMIMPEMDGMTALRFIRQKTPDVKVLISSGYTSPEKVPMLERIGIEGFVQKPYELGKLASTVRDVLDGVAV
ncbi:MAG: hybrid sensor histidine kinase/response regulator, partial [Acidobacteria bacterium]